MTRRTSKRLAALAAGATAMAGLALVGAAPALADPTTPGPDDPAILNSDNEAAVDGEYVVVFRNQGQSVAASRRSAAALAREHGGRVTHSYGRVIDGYAARMTEAQALDVAGDPKVAYVEQAVEMVAYDTQVNPPNWGVDRIDQDDLPLDRSYAYPAHAGQGVDVYVLDSGINAGHTEFSGRVGAGYDAIDEDADPADCHGHGTHVAGSAVGAAYGVAKKATLHGVRILDCRGSGSSTDILQGFDWVRGHASGPAVANYSVGCRYRCTNDSISTAIDNLTNGGVAFVQAAGNSDDDACYYGEKDNRRAITVGSSTSNDERSSFSNHGTCLDVFAPGSSIISASHTSTTGTATMSGTSMASPHVAGVAALYLAANPSATQAQVEAALVDNAILQTLTGVGTGSPNRLLNTAFLGDATPSTVTVAQPGDQSSTVGEADRLAMSASGGTSPYTWSATGLPAGLSIHASTGVVSGTPTAAGASNVTVTARDSSSPAKSGSTTFSWTVAPVGSCAPQTNGTDVTIADNATVESPLTVSGCSGNASASSKVAVDIKHTYIGDLKVDLVAPDGTVRTLHNRAGGSADNINTTWTVDLSAEARNGTWKLRVNDNASLDSGYIDSWTLDTGGSSGPACAPQTNGTDVTIADNATVESPLTVSGCSGNASASSTVAVDIKHTYIGDLKVDLVAPDGTVRTLHNRAGGSADNINTTWTVDLSAEARNGTWKLRVNDNASLDSGYIDSWTLTTS